jgi:hypothetical protein
MKFLVVTNSGNGQLVYIPVKRVITIRYPAANGKTLIVWEYGDRSTTYEEFEEKPDCIPIISTAKGDMI